MPRPTRVGRRAETRARRLCLTLLTSTTKARMATQKAVPKAVPKAAPKAAPKAQKTAEGEWNDGTYARGEFFRYEEGAVLVGRLGECRRVKGKFGVRTVREVVTAEGDLQLVDAKSFARRIVVLPTGAEVRLEVGEKVDSDAGNGTKSWSGRLQYRLPNGVRDVPPRAPMEVQDLTTDPAADEASGPGTEDVPF